MFHLVVKNDIYADNVGVGVGVGVGVAETGIVKMVNAGVGNGTVPLVSPAMTDPVVKYVNVYNWLVTVFRIVKLSVTETSGADADKSPVATMSSLQLL